jgi:glutathione S-transferase
MLRIWGRANSINVQKVLLCVDELGAPYERVDAGLQFGVTDTPEYRALNPNGLVPTLEEDGFVLWESNSIVRYLCAADPKGRACPSDLRRRADLERWMDWQLSVLHAPVATLFWGLVRSPGSRSPEDVAAAMEKAHAAMAVLGQRLSDRPWISGQAIGMADFAIAPYVHRWLNLPGLAIDQTEVRRYYQSLMELASARKTLTLPLT